MKKHWKELVVSAAPLIAFLQRDSFFEQSYGGNVAGVLVLTDPRAAFKYAVDDAAVDHDEWESVSESPGIFPPDFEWSSWVTHQLAKNDFFGFSSKNFNGADAKWTRGEACLIHELMYRDAMILFNCYSNDYFPDLWRDVLEVYLNDGFPCGWSGRYPEGKLVVFSNLC